MRRLEVAVVVTALLMSLLGCSSVESSDVIADKNQSLIEEAENLEAKTAVGFGAAVERRSIKLHYDEDMSDVVVEPVG